MPFSGFPCALTPLSATCIQVVAGGGAIEMELAKYLAEYSLTLSSKVGTGLGTQAGGEGWERPGPSTKPCVALLAAHACLVAVPRC